MRGRGYRGREVFSAIYKEFPDAVILSLWFMSKYDFWLEQGRQMSPKANAEQSGELMFHFMNGILDVIPPEARIVDAEDSTFIDFKDFSVIKIGDSLPVWPAETLREKKKY